MNNCKFSHVDNLTLYMRKVLEIVKYDNVGRDKSKRTILDIPAGNGLLSEKLNQLGFQVTSVDINEEKPYFFKVNLEEKLPFPNESFDYTLCLEGLEHVISPTQTLTYYQLLYLFKQHGCEIEVVEGDKYKRKALVPIYGIIIAINYLLSLLGRTNKLAIYKFSFSKKLLLSRSLILKFTKITPSFSTSTTHGFRAIQAEMANCN